MPDQDASSSQRMRQHFAQRVIHLARQVLEYWQRIQDGHWDYHPVNELRETSQRLLQCAQHFHQEEHIQLAAEILDVLCDVDHTHQRFNNEQLNRLNQVMQRLSRTGLRHNDRLEEVQIPTQPKPIYLALNDLTTANHIAQQLGNFALNVQILQTPEAFIKAINEQRPAAVVMDIDFSVPNAGLALAEMIRSKQESRLPLLFFSRHDADVATHLRTVRAGGQEFIVGTLDALYLLERIEELTHSAPEEPYRVLIVDDSRAQALYVERALNQAGIITRIQTDPLRAMTDLFEFQPDLIILDMYMPVCNGCELARVIRYDNRYVSVPIIYLSAEEDLDKQLEAMSQGGDDFLTKPIKPEHLIATVRNRAARARSLRAHMMYDSLTGLYNHTSILQLLEDACVKAQRTGQTLSFAMLDLDHFKKVNDHYGHLTGDRILRTLSLLLKQRLRKTDLLGRYGGEEFAIALRDTDLQQAARIIDEIRISFAGFRYPDQNPELACTFSCGIAELCPNCDSRDLIKKADKALYQAKDNGRNRVEIFCGQELQTD